MLIYKIIARQTWHQAESARVFHGAGIDLSDGFIHLSTADQAETTARLHFAGQDDLLLVAFKPEDFMSTFKCDASRGGALFPHVYGTIDPSQAQWKKPLLWDGSAHHFPEGWR